MRGSVLGSDASLDLDDIKETGKPTVLTVNGQAEVVVRSAEAYQMLLDDHELLESVRRISRGLEQARRRKARPMRDFLEALSSGHGLSRK